MIRKLLLMTSLMALPMVSAGDAQAREYCREYTKTIYIGGKAVEGYGTACRQEDGAWEVSQLEGPDKAKTKVREYIVDDLRDQGARNIVILNERRYVPTTTRVVHYHNGVRQSRYHNYRHANYGYKHSKKHYKKAKNYKKYSSKHNYSHKPKEGFSISYYNR